MLRSIIILVLAINCIEFGFGQTEQEKQLLAVELEYFYATSDSLRTRCVVKKMNLFFSENQVNDRLFVEIQRLDNRWVLEEEKANVYWNICLASYLLDEPYYFLKYANRLKDLEGSSTQIELLDFLMQANKSESNAELQLANLVEKDSVFCDLNTLISASFYEYRFNDVARISSFIVPGTGLFVVKNPLKGLTSMGLNTASFFAIRYLVQNNLYINTVGWGVNLIQRFYLGGMSLTEKMIAQNEKKQKAHLAVEAENALLKVLEVYPLEFRD